jgi:hypothetical protein
MTQNNDANDDYSNDNHHKDVKWHFKMGQYLTG